jgi:hypothetical protein
MITEKDGGAAFPLYAEANGRLQSGMSVRTYMATKFMAASIGSVKYLQWVGKEADDRIIAQATAQAIVYADALIAELAKEPTK